jgi:hypothetical protein
MILYFNDILLYLSQLNGMKKAFQLLKGESNYAIQS